MLFSKVYECGIRAATYIAGQSVGGGRGIVATHHRYVAESLPMLYELSAKVARVHGDRHPETVDIARYFDAVAQELQMHKPKEERILFPYINGNGTDGLKT